MSNCHPAGPGFRLTEPYNRVLSLFPGALLLALCSAWVRLSTRFPILEVLVAHVLFAVRAISLPLALAHVESSTNTAAS